MTESLDVSDRGRADQVGHLNTRGRTSLSFRDAVRRLGQKQKPSAGAPAYSRFVNRPVGRVLAAASFKLGLTPNGVTSLSAIFSFLAIALIALVSPSLLLGIVVASSLAIGYAFDSADGQLARLRGGGSPSGEWLDHMVDATKISSLHLAVLIGFYRFGEWPGPGWMLVPIGYTVVAAVMFFGMILIDQIRRQNRQLTETMPNQPSSLLRSLLVLPTDYGFLCLSFVLLGWGGGFVIAYSAFFLGNVLFMVLALVKWFGETRAMGREVIQGEMC